MCSRFLICPSDRVGSSGDNVRRPAALLRSYEGRNLAWNLARRLDPWRLAAVLFRT